MRLDRNVNVGRMGKYALVNLRRYNELPPDKASEALDLLSRLDSLGIIDKGVKGESDEFFVLKLKDKYAADALHAYANAAVDDDQEYAAEVAALATRSEHHPDKKQPD